MRSSRLSPNFEKRYCDGLLKRSFDIVFATIGLIIASPVMIVMAILVKVDSSGPIIFRAERSGLNGSRFNILKFRSMVLNADKMGGLSAGARDPRVTRVGKILRRSKLDELPQFINVLTGHMSIVGPRPEHPSYTKRYTSAENAILSVKPGLTDYASIELIQIADLLGAEAPDEVYEQKIWPIKNSLRLRYVAEQSLRVDLKIIACTLIRLIQLLCNKKQH